MTKKQHIALLERQVKIGEEMMQVAEQNYNAAARSVSEAKSALTELGGSKGQARKGNYELPPDVLLSMKAGLTKAKKSEDNQ